MASRAHSAPSPRLRIGPRRGSRAGRVRWDRLGRLMLVGFVLFILFSYVNPAVNLFDTWRDARGEQQRLGRLKNEQKRLLERLEAAKSPARVTREARKQGMLVPGERAYAIRGLGE